MSLPLSRGSSDQKPPFIRDVQAQLNKHVNANLQTTGGFGSGTEAAVKKFQAAKGLKVTGIVDTATWDKLKLDPATPPPPPVDPPPPPTINYVFQEEFNGPAGSAPDSGKWNHETGLWDENGELETYVNDRSHSFLDGNGSLVIRATKEAGGVYKSARLTSQGKFDHASGTWEARIKYSISPGIWPAFWMIGANFGSVGWPRCGEIDMLENYGGPRFETSVHTDDGSGEMTTKSLERPIDTNWHTYRMEWDASNNLRFYLDGALYLTVKPTDLPNWPFTAQGKQFLIMNVAVGGASGNPTSATKFPADMLVDYIRVW